MKVIRKVPFEFEGEQYETRVLLDDEGYHVITYKGKKPANAIRHSAAVETAVDFGEGDALGLLIRQSREVVEQKVWERLQALERGEE
jgi:methyl coenzyme M reductase beta subunit